MDHVRGEFASQVHVLVLLIDGSTGCRAAPDSHSVLVEPLFCRWPKVVVR